MHLFPPPLECNLLRIANVSFFVFVLTATSTVTDTWWVPNKYLLIDWSNQEQWREVAQKQIPVDARIFLKEVKPPETIWNQDDLTKEVKTILEVFKRRLHYSLLGIRIGGYVGPLHLWDSVLLILSLANSKLLWGKSLSDLW